MPQNGFHGLVGLATAKGTARRVPNVGAAAFVFGTVLGSMLPDIDMYPTAIAVLLHRGDLTYVIHRSATHCLLAVLLLLVLGALLRGKSTKVAYGLIGLGLGMLTHEVLDIFFWFAPIDLFWPFSHLPDGQALPIVNVWSGVPKIPPLALNIREAFEFCAFALFLTVVGNIAASQGADVRALRKWQTFIWIMFGVALVTAFLFRTNDRLQNYVVTTPYLLLFLPYCWKQVWNFRREITAWALGDVRATGIA